MAAIRSEGGANAAPEALSPGVEDAHLLAGVGRGSQEAFRQLVDRHLGPVTGIARRMLRDDAEAEDVAQEAFLRLWRMGASLEIGASGVRPWLRRVVSNLCIDRIRGSGRQIVTDEVPEQIEEPGQLSGLEAAQLGAKVDAALKTLPDRQRLALTLFHFDGMSQNEVAAAMEISAEAVESLLARARRGLKAALKDEWMDLKND